MNISGLIFCKTELAHKISRRLLSSVRLYLQRSEILSLEDEKILAYGSGLIYNTRSLQGVWQVDTLEESRRGATSLSSICLPVDCRITPATYHGVVGERLDSLSAVDGLNPPFFAVRYSRKTREFRALSDHSGIGRAYYIDTQHFLVASNSIMFCRFFDRHEIKSNLRAWREFSGFGWFVGDDSPYDRVKRMPPSTVLSIGPAPQTRISTYFDHASLYARREPSADQLHLAQTEMKTLCHNACQLAKEPPILMLSGGRDSRVTCAAWIASGAPARIRTIGTLQKEADTAVQLMSAVDGPFEHTVVDRGRASDPDEPAASTKDILECFRLATRRYDGDAPPIRGCRPVAPYRPSNFVVGGGGGEIAHGNYYPTREILDEVYADPSPVDRLVRYFSRSLEVHEDGPDLVRERLLATQETLRGAGIDGPTILDGFYFLERFRRWVIAGHDTHTVLPFATRSFIRLAFDATPEERLARRVHMRLTSAFVPQWKDIPYFKASGGPDEAHEKGLRLWQGADAHDVFTELRRIDAVADAFSPVPVLQSVIDVLLGKSSNRVEAAFQRVLWYSSFLKNTHQLRLRHASGWKRVMADFEPGASAGIETPASPAAPGAGTPGAQSAGG